ncbi:hypothetical protein NLJ89_g11541 [Agrocybe chaxingu]|uniref:Uncharacterized protein n=1 Tax=Agrocybe chaxingu TaxID=84603 RepID=A0A9W8JP67_9AGAR|nr:hypothetical protein NLJ89_g11541 [Agrocybe chaxingu]
MTAITKDLPFTSWAEQLQNQKSLGQRAMFVVYRDMAKSHPTRCKTMISSGGPTEETTVPGQPDELTPRVSYITTAGRHPEDKGSTFMAIAVCIGKVQAAPL